MAGRRRKRNKSPIVTAKATMRVVIGGDYPENPPNPVGGVQAIIYNTVAYLRHYDDLELHVVTCEKWRDRALDKPEVVHDGSLTVHYLPSSPHVPHALSLWTADRWAVRRRIEAIAPDLIHVHGQAAAYPLAALDTRRPALVTVQGINTLEAQLDQRGGALKGRLRTLLWSRAEQYSLRRATDLVITGPFVREVVSPYTRGRLHLIENPVHDAFFLLTPEPQPGKVLTVGSVQKRKGTLEAIKAMALVRRQVPYAQLWVAGGFLQPYQEYGDLVKRYVAETGAEDYVHFMGHLGQEELLQAHRTGEVFLFPTYLEGSPVALAEAMASGLAAVVSDIPSTVHLTEEGVTGYRVPAGDVEALAARTIRLLTDEAARHSFAQQARARAQERFTQELAARKTHDLYLALAGSRP